MNKYSLFLLIIIAIIPTVFGQQAPIQEWSEADREYHKMLSDSHRKNLALVDANNIAARLAMVGGTAADHMGWLRVELKRDIEALRQSYADVAVTAVNEMLSDSESRKKLIDVLLKSPEFEKAIKDRLNK